MEMGSDKGNNAQTVGLMHWEFIPAYTLQDVLDALPKYYHIANIGWTKLSIRVHTTKSGKSDMFIRTNLANMPMDVVY